MNELQRIFSHALQDYHSLLKSFLVLITVFLVVEIYESFVKNLDEMKENNKYSLRKQAVWWEIGLTLYTIFAITIIIWLEVHEKNDKRLSQENKETKVHKVIRHDEMMIKSDMTTYKKDIQIKVNQNINCFIDENGQKYYTNTTPLTDKLVIPCP